jgi:SAM-dependent methyltransferase
MISLRTEKKQDMFEKASLCFRANDLRSATKWLERILDKDPEDNPALALMAEVCLMRGEKSEALGLLVLAVCGDPDKTSYLNLFTSCVKDLTFSFSSYNPSMARALEACIAREDIDCMYIWRLWYALLACHPEISDLASDDIAFDSAETAALTSHPFFLGGLRRLVVCDWAFEKRMTSLRAALFRDLSLSRNLWDRERFLKVAAALSCYCYTTEYLFAIGAEERKWVEDMRRRMSDNPRGVRAEEIVLFACYEPLGNFSSAKILAEICDAETPLIPVSKLQIYETLRMAEIKDSVVSITPINDEVSSQVQGQYETFPYPRWLYLPQWSDKAEAEAFLPQDARILVAGCGTGYESAHLGMLFPQGHVTAIDLSKSSISYAIARAQEIGLSNVTFAQADILRMADKEERYDYIFSSGVLHHMSDPMAGWRSLRGLLKPSGLMRIGLYSEIGRRSVVVARNVIRDHGFAANHDGMNQFRRRAEELLPPEDFSFLSKSGEFYQMSMFCDLLFHVQEHRFNLLQISDMLEELSLRFDGFKLPLHVFNKFRDMHGARADLSDLEKWHSFEETHPVTFSNMYQFWCRAKD